MSNTKIKGQAEIWAVHDGTSYVDIALLTENGITENRNVIEGSGKGEDSLTRETGVYDASGSIEGLFIETEASKISWNEMKAYIRNLTDAKRSWRITTTYSDASTDVEYFSAVLSSLEKGAPNEEFMTFSAEVSVSGKISSTDPEA